MTMTTEELQRLVDGALEGVERARQTRGRSVGGAGGQTIEESLRATMHQISAYDLDVMVDAIVALRAERDRLREALEWYGENARLARLIHSGGDQGRALLAADGGKKAASALSASSDKKGESA